MSDKSETEVLRQLKKSISLFIERIGQEVQQLHQLVTTIQREVKVIKTKNDVQLIELTSRISNLENSVAGLEQTAGKPFLGALADREPLIPQESIASSQKSDLISTQADIPSSETQITDQTPISTPEMPKIETPVPEVEKKEEKRELLKALQLIDSL